MVSIREYWPRHVDVFHCHSATHEIVAYTAGEINCPVLLTNEMTNRKAFTEFSLLWDGNPDEHMEGWDGDAI